ncbi:MAG: ATP-binding cassette domain-containing protein, partial [Parcubacteria group bacterium]|nr:ATP-binding cassette domain-containing protein [Parcubacteria group bacterium]
LSGGMKRKMEIIRSLMHKPKVLFLDEPTSGLDPLSRKGLWEYLTQVQKREDTTIFLTTHYLEEAEDADRICIINEGKIVSLGTPNEIKRTLVENYLLVDSTQKDKLKQELARNKIEFVEEKNLKIALGGKTPQALIHSIKTPLSYLYIHTPTLEDAYFEIVGGKT